MENFVELNHISKNFTPSLSFSQIVSLKFQNKLSTHAITDLSFSLEKGKILGILGPNGAGKTTLLKIIATLLFPDSGTISIAGKYIEKDNLNIRSLIGFSSLQERGFYWRLTGKQNLEFFMALHNIDSKTAFKKANELSELFRFLDLNKRFDSYSAGMKQAISLIRALAHDPELLLLDEPTKSLDYLSAQRFMQFVLDELATKRNKTIIFTTHHLEEISNFCDKAIILKNGRLRETLTKSTLKAEFNSLKETYEKIALENQ
ncbi:MAG: ABC transporter ATP-binding protein [Candidatus Omnitrophica bacterium]|nr:ABC transporter ATP-binding protein [Candidatus Omnitrophota bacterium]